MCTGANEREHIHTYWTLELCQARTSYMSEKIMSERAIVRMSEPERDFIRMYNV